jgi:hypothetical protein
MINALAVGTKVTVRTTSEDPPHLECSPHTRIVEVQDGDNGQSQYYVGHPAEGNFRATRFGPFDRARLKVGWT